MKFFQLKARLFHLPGLPLFKLLEGSLSNRSFSSVKVGTYCHFTYLRVSKAATEF